MRTRTKTLLVLLALLLLGGVGVVATGFSSTKCRTHHDAVAAGAESDGEHAKAHGAGTTRRARAHSAESPASSPAGGGTDSSPPAAKAEGANVPSAAATASPPPPEKLNGRVVDDATNEPLAGVRVHYTVLVDEKAATWNGETTNREGVFDNPRPNGWDKKGARMELRVAKEGYETMRVPVVEAAPVVRLRRQERPPAPGRVLGVVRNADGIPVVGVVLVEGKDEIDANAAQYAVADAAGAFVLEGVPPGYWRFAMSPGKSVEVLVPSGGEARMELVVPRDPRDDEERVHGRSPDSIGYNRPSVVRDADGRRPAPREVIVTDLPDVAGTVARVTFPDLVPRLFWRTESKAGEARFPRLSVGRWTLTVLVPGKPPSSMTLEVAAGEGPLRVAFAGN